VRAVLKAAVYVCLFTVLCMVNSVLGWRLPLPDLIPNTEPAPQCVLPGTVPQTTPPGAATSAYGNPATAGQPALSFPDVFPDLPSAMGDLQGQALRKLNGPPPSQAQIRGFFGAIKDGVVRWEKSLRASARGEKAPAEVSAYETRKRETLAQNVTSCNPCQPHADGSPRPYNQAGYTGAGSPGEQVARRAAVAAGFTGIHIEEAVEVARAETGGTFKATAANPRSSARGVWQIMLSAHQNDPDITRWADPYASARMAYRISSGGTHWWPAWTTWPTARKHVHANPGQATAQNVADGMECAVYPTAAKGAGPGPWGGYSNGRIPRSALAHPTSAPNALFRPDAAAAFDQLNAAYRARFGVGITVTDSYRDLATQVRTKARKKGLAAEPGTSNHGWGLAADLGGGINQFGTPQHEWFAQNGPRYGWDFPAWGRQGGSGPIEPWHAEFNGKGAAA
jgi:hypothetical protein